MKVKTNGPVEVTIEWEKGDLVVLASGGPVMTVERPTSGPQDREVGCVWWHEEKRNYWRDYFPAAGLRPANTADLTLNIEFAISLPLLQVSAEEPLVQPIEQPVKPESSEGESTEQEAETCP